jgi:hypothetical protein
MSLASGNLTTVSNAKMWIVALAGTTQADTLIAQLISRTSAQIRSWLARPSLLSQNYTRIFDGSGTGKQTLPDWPVTAVSLVQVGNWIIPPMPLPMGGGVISLGFPALFGNRIDLWDGTLPGQPTSVQLLGGVFPRWSGQDIRVEYTAGYLISAEAQTVPASPGPYLVTVDQPQGLCALDGGVSYVGGAALEAVTGPPGRGQYNAPQDTAPGQYTFSAADAGAPVTISYSFVPADLSSACEQAVAMQYAQISMFNGLSFAGGVGDMRVGDTALRAAGGVKMTPGMLFSPAITAACQPYRQVAPVRH